MLPEISVSIWDRIHKACAREVYSQQNGQPFVPTLLSYAEVRIPKTNTENGIFVLCGKDPFMSEKNPYSDVSKTTNCSRTPLIAKWYLGGTNTNSLMTRWSIDDVSLRMFGYSLCYNEPTPKDYASEFIHSSCARGGEARMTCGLTVGCRSLVSVASWSMMTPEGPGLHHPTRTKIGGTSKHKPRVMVRRWGRE